MSFKPVKVSFGILLIFLIAGKFPYGGSSYEDIVYNISMNLGGDVPFKDELELTEKILKCLELFFKEEPTLKTALKNYENMAESIDVLIAKNATSNHNERMETFYLYCFEALMTKFEIAGNSVSKRVRDFIALSNDCDIHNNNIFYLAECDNCEELKIDFF